MKRYFKYNMAVIFRGFPNDDPQEKHLTLFHVSPDMCDIYINTYIHIMVESKISTFQHAMNAVQYFLII